MLRAFKDLPKTMQNEQVAKYYDHIKEQKTSLQVKRGLDIFLSILLMVILAPVMLIVALLIKVDSKGPVIYSQKRVTQYGRLYSIYKFRTMTEGADKKGLLVTGKEDVRITKIGATLRRYRIDEIPQLFNVITGDMTFVGTRPEVPKYVESYTDEMKATLLLPAGITSDASIKYKDETEVIEIYQGKGMETEDIYTNVIIPGKMQYNLKYLKEFSFFKDIKVLVETIFAVLG